MSKIDKQAVLVIHGIGEQRPMDTLRGFVRAVWTSDRSVQKEHGVDTVWSKPDTISGSFELRRLTTGRNAAEVRTDFFEFYWAHLMHGTTVGHVGAWAWLILLRWPWNVPRQLLGAWLLVMGLVFAVCILALKAFFWQGWPPVAVPGWLYGVASIALALLAKPLIKNVLGDAARYLNRVPSNVQRRQEIRTKGVELLQKLHLKGYGRIIVVGHSLGSVIGYDILTYAWALHNGSVDTTRAHPKMQALETKLEADLKRDPSAEKLRGVEYQREQREVLDELIDNGLTWRVTDFVTLGSPLAHATLLLAEDETDLKNKRDAREFPQCPPVLENGKFSYDPKDDRRKPHHAAVFGPTRWTNLYFSTHLVLWGDPVGGPLDKNFGRGVLDVPVSTGQRLGMFSHTLYWKFKGGTPTHIEALRDSVNLLDMPRPNASPTE